MRNKSYLSLLLLGLTASAPLPKVKSVAVAGDYLEVRTASVFCGACHYNGERVTEGRDALLAWNITRGTWHGVSLAGVRAVAEVSAKSNLLDMDATRTCEIVIDSAATDAQATAMSDLIRETGGADLGAITDIRRAVVTFKHDGDRFEVAAENFATLDVQSLPNNECCSQPHEVWYEPLVSVDHRKVGYTQSADYTSGTNGDAWQREDENSALYGPILVLSR